MCVRTLLMRARARKYLLLWLGIHQEAEPLPRRGARCCRCMRPWCRSSTGGVRASTGLPLAWYDVLLELSGARDGRLTMSQLGERVVLSRSRVSRVVDEPRGPTWSER